MWPTSVRLTLSKRSTTLGETRSFESDASGLQLDQLAEVLGGLLREADPEVGAAAVLVGLGQDVLAARRQRARPERLEPGDQLVEDHDRAALLRPVELGDGARERVLRGLHLELERGRRLRPRLLLAPRAERAPRASAATASRTLAEVVGRAARAGHLRLAA